MVGGEQDFIRHAGVTTADAKYAGALLLSTLRSIKNACAGANDSLTEAGHDWLAADGPNAGNNAIVADIVAAIDPNCLALLERYADNTVATAGEQLA